MTYNPNIPHRRSIRLKGYDYSRAGLYFITICVKNRKCLFGKIINDEMVLNDTGEMVEAKWLELPQRFKNIQLHEFIVMPNHFHAILEIVAATLVVAPKGQPQGIAPTIAQTDTPTSKTVGDMVGAFQSIVTVEYIRGVKNANWPRFNKKLWQRDYWEHIIRNEQSYKRISDYIRDNPAKWKGDKFYT
ncbi:MAG: transposase [Bacteroidales bacterium]|nr:transposase [Bacteroidales bacterium]MCF8457759.1 transposase [Bacteroidales bacterium]